MEFLMELFSAVGMTMRWTPVPPPPQGFGAMSGPWSVHLPPRINLRAHSAVSKQKTGRRKTEDGINPRSKVPSHHRQPFSRALPFGSHKPTVSHGYWQTHPSTAPEPVVDHHAGTTPACRDGLSVSPPAIASSTHRGIAIEWEGGLSNHCPFRQRPLAPAGSTDTRENRRVTAISKGPPFKNASMSGPSTHLTTILAV